MSQRARRDLEAERRAWTDLIHDPHEHPAGSGDGIVHLPSGLDDPEHLVADRVAIAAMEVTQLAVGRRVEVESLDPKPDLIRPQLRDGCPAGLPTGATRRSVRAPDGARRGADGTPTRAETRLTVRLLLDGKTCGVASWMPRILLYRPGNGIGGVKDGERDSDPHEIGFGTSASPDGAAWAPSSRISIGSVSWSNLTGPRFPGWRSVSPSRTGGPRSGSGPTASRTSASCGRCWATSSTSRSTTTWCVTSKSEPPCRCCCHRRC